MGLRCCGEAQGHMSGEAAIPAFAAQLAVVAEAAFTPFPAPARKALPSPALRCDGVVVTQARRRLRPIRWPIQLDGDSISLAFTAREVLSLSRILLSMRDATIVPSCDQRTVLTSDGALRGCGGVDSVWALQSRRRPSLLKSRKR